jgi:hypothetical protein
MIFRCKDNRFIVNLFNLHAIFLIFCPNFLIFAEKEIEKFGSSDKFVYLCAAFEFKHQHQTGCP